jgi:GT2 family glycosyltransferase
LTFELLNNEQRTTINDKRHTKNDKRHHPMTDLSIIIVCYKGWEPLKKCLDALDSFTGNAFSLEVLIVDNKSDDDTIIEIERNFPKFRFIYNTINGGFANGCNLGAKNASGEFLLFLNPDTVASESAIYKLLLTAKQNPDYGIVSCRQINESGKEGKVTGEFPSIFNLTGFQRAIFKHRKPRTANSQPELDFPDWVSGSVILIRSELFNKLNGFDEDFWMYFEDVDLCKRVSETRKKIAYCRNITIEHNHGGSSRFNLVTASLTKTEVYISRHLYISKNKKTIEKILIQLFLVLNNLITGGIMALIGLLLFFVPKLFLRTLIYFRLLNYYFRALIWLSWVSTLSVNFHK